MDIVVSAIFVEAGGNYPRNPLHPLPHPRACHATVTSHRARDATTPKISPVAVVLTTRDIRCYAELNLHRAYMQRVAQRSSAFHAEFSSVFVMRNLPIENPSLVKPDGITQRQENFARHYVTHGSVVEAYVHAYDVAPTTNRNSLRSTSYNVLNNPKVRARVAALQAATNAQAVMSTAELISELEAMATADVSEVVALTVGACRHCWGYGHRYQWRDEFEYARAFDEALAATKPLPDMAGGFGYRSDREPHAECSQCDGAGMHLVRFTSTDQLSPAARKLLKSVELFPDGSLKRLHLHDQLAVRMELHRVKGMHVDRSISVTAHVPGPSLKELSNEQALDYLERLRPTRPVLATTVAPPALAVPTESDVIDANFTAVEAVPR